MITQIQDYNLDFSCSEDRYMGVKSLWLKVIVRAMFDWASYRDSQKLQDQKKAQDAYAWLFKESELFNSFKNVCMILSINPDKIRQLALKMTKDDVAKIEFKEREVVFSDDEEDQEFTENEIADNLPLLSDKLESDSDFSDESWDAL